MKGKKVLVAYFSHSGNTRAVAEMIHGIAGGQVFEIQAVDPYPKDYEETKARAMKELEAGARPKLRNHLADTTKYDVVFVGYPNWWGTMPMPVMTFLAENGGFAGGQDRGSVLHPRRKRAGAQRRRSCQDLSQGEDPRWARRPRTEGKGCSRRCRGLVAGSGLLTWLGRRLDG